MGRPARNRTQPGLATSLARGRPGPGGAWNLESRVTPAVSGAGTTADMHNAMGNLWNAYMAAYMTGQARDVERTNHR